MKCRKFDYCSVKIVAPVPRQGDDISSAAAFPHLRGDGHLSLTLTPKQVNYEKLHDIGLGTATSR